MQHVRFYHTESEYHTEKSKVHVKFHQELLQQSLKARDFKPDLGLQTNQKLAVDNLLTHDSIYLALIGVIFIFLT